MADFEALKDQWSDIEDRDGIRLSWNTFPSSRMVRHAQRRAWYGSADKSAGSLTPSGTHWRAVHAAEGEDGHAAAAV